MQTLKATKREQFGKALATARKAGNLPVVIYGPKEPSISAFVSESEFRKVWKTAGESSVVSLVIDGVGSKEVLIHEVEEHPVTSVPIHVDLYAIEAGKKVEVGVPLVFEGVSPAVKNLGATLVKVLHEIEIAALPANLPHEIKVNIGSLETLESKIHARDINLPTGVELVTEAEEVVALVAEHEEEEEATSAPADLSTIEVEKKGKQEEEGAENTSKTEKKGESGKK